MVLREESLIDILYRDPTEIPKQRFWDNFDGDALNTNIWTFEETSGPGGTTLMLNEIDGGLRLSAPDSASGRTFLKFNQIHHYEPTGCVYIAIMRSVETSSFTADVGLGDGGAAEARILWQKHSAVAWRSVHNQDSGGQTLTDSGITADANFHTFKGQIYSSSLSDNWIDGILRTTVTTNMPDVPLQPFLKVGRVFGSGVKKMDIRYYEAYNT